MSDIDDNIKEYEEVEIMMTSIELKQRTATGRVYTGIDCEYIKLGSVTLKDSCTDGKDENVHEDEYNDDEFREQVCDQACKWSQEAVPDPEWGSCSWFCHQREDICKLYILYRSNNKSRLQGVQYKNILKNMQNESHQVVSGLSDVDLSATTTVAAADTTTASGNLLII